MNGITIITKNSKTGDHFEQFHERKAVLEFGLQNSITWMHDGCGSDVIVSIKREVYND